MHTRKILWDQQNTDGISTCVFSRLSRVRLMEQIVIVIVYWALIAFCGDGTEAAALPMGYMC